MPRWLTVTAGVAAAALLADTLVWVAGSQVLSAQITRCIDEMQAQGWAVSAGGRSAGGWPFIATETIDRVGLTGGEHVLPGGLTWSADRVVISVSLAHPMTLTIAPEGQQFLRISHLQDIGFTAVQAIVHLPLLARGRGSLYAAGISGGIAGSRHPQDVQIATLSLLAGQAQVAAPRSVMHAELHAIGIGLPDIGRWPLGATIASAGINLALASPALADKRAETGDARAAAWRDGGGKLTIDDGKLRWGPLAVAVQGELGLDGKLQPSGTGLADIAGSAPALDLATRAGVIPPRLALTTQAALAVMAHVPGADGTDTVRLPVQLRDNMLSVGGVPLLRTATVAWRGGGPSLASEPPP